MSTAQIQIFGKKIKFFIARVVRALPEKYKKVGTALFFLTTFKKRVIIFLCSKLF